MRTDISRNTFRPGKYYSSVRRQQGRVDLDADWNEQADIFHQDARLRFVDSMGPIGAPSNDSGFQIAPSGDSLDLTVSSGRFYIDGVLVRNESEFNVSTQPDLPGVAMPSADGDYLAYLKVHERAVTALEDPELRETALGGPDTTTRMKVIRQIQFAPVSESDIDSRTVPAVWSTIISRNPGRMSARTEADGGSDPCAVGARGGYTGLDNLLYRVEIHDGGQAGAATYKWSRDNGSLVTEWLEQEGDTLTLRSTGNDNVLNFAPGQWVELTDEGMELEGIAGTLAQILRVEGRRITINPDNIQHFAGSAGTLDINEFSRGVRKVRRWDNTELVAPPIVPDGAGGEVWITLENGIQVKFDDLASTREYRTGDYWMIPARADNNNIEWPCDNNGNIEHVPHGTYFYYARLAFVNLTGGNWSVIADAREIFPGLTDEELVYVGGDGQLSVPGQILDRPLEVRVTRGATPVADAKVRFTVTSGTGTIEDSPGGTSGTTLDIKADSEGIARVYWTLLDATAGQSVRAVLLDESDTETALYVVFGAGSGVASGIQYTPISTDSSVAGTINVQEALDALADNKVNRAGDTMTGNLTVNADLEVTGNMTIRGDVIARDAQQQAGDVLLGDDDIDRVIIHGTLQSNHTSGSLEIEGPVHINTTDPAKSPLRVDGPSTGGSPRLYRLPLDLDNTAGGAAALTDYQLPITVDTATPIAAGRMESDGADILFEDQDGTNLPYWIESGINTAATSIWVRIPSLPSGTNRTIYMLYGNENAVSQSSSANTFVRDISGLDLAYNFDEGSGTTAVDYSGNASDGTISGATYTTGLFGEALNFDGTTNVVQTTPAWSAIGTGDFSISLWMRPEVIAGDARVFVCDQSINNFQFNIDSSGELAMYVGSAPPTSSPFAWTLNQWHHLAVTRNAGLVTLYVDGASIFAGTNTNSIAASTTLDIGYRTSNNAHPFDGQIDEVRILNRALSADEIADLAANTPYFSPALPGSDLLRRTPVQEPTITAQAEEANPLSETPILFAQESSGNVGIGTDAPGEKLTVDGVIETKTGGIKFPDGTIQTTAGGPGGGGGEPLPIGTIMAWHRDFAGSPAIPDGWVECNGQVLNDSESPYDGLVIPNLNGQKEPWNSKGSFLRGGATSGEFEDDQMQGHIHRYNQVSTNFTPGAILTGGGQLPHIDNNSTGPLSDGTNGTPRVGSETRPVNMSVVWIMKIKETGEAGLWTPNSEGIHFNAGKVSVGTDVTDEQLTVTGAISIEEKVLEPDTTDDFGKIYVRENDLSYLKLNGMDQYVSMPPLGNAAVGDFTVAMWFRVRRQKDAPNNRSFLMDMRGDGTDGLNDIVFIVDDSTNGTTEFAAGVGWPSGDFSSFQIDLGLITGEWHHMAMVRENNFLRAYYDGRFLSDSPTSGVPPKTDPLDWNTPFRLGTYSAETPAGDNNWHDGDLDDAGFWTRALTDDEIAALHKGGRGSDVPTAFASSLVAFYPMSSSLTANQIDDTSGNNFHGTIQNGGSIIPERVGTLYFKDGFGNVTSLAGGGDSYRTGGSGNQVPLGTIMAWHKDHPGYTPIIPDGWVECNGQTLDDPASPYHGQAIPDLNGEGRFLRGSDTSGDFQADEFRSHSHQQTTGAFGENIGNGIRAFPHNGQFGSTLSTIATGGSETRPINMSVVWIMKVRETDRDRGLWRESGEDIYFDDGRVGVGAKTANTKLHISSNDLEEAPLRVDAKVTLQGVQGRLYRAPINLENTDTNDLVDYQIPLTLDTATLVSAGKMRFDGGDMLFVDSDGKTLLPHTIESGMNTASTIVWVRVPSIAAGETRDIFIQYGKNDATDLASAEATFVQDLDGLVVAFDFEEGSGTAIADSSGLNNNGSTSGTWTTGYRGSALSYNGTQGSVISARPWGFSTTGTMSAWIKTNTISAGNFNTIAHLAHTTFEDEFLIGVRNDGTLNLLNHNSNNVYAYRGSTSSVLTGDWVHVVGVMDGGFAAENMRVYVNGVREDGAYVVSGSPFAISDATPRIFEVGNRGTGENFIGEIDQVRVFNRALSDQEVADMFAHESLLVAGYTSREFIYKALSVPPTITVAAEEPNPVSGSPVLFAQNLTGNIGLGTDEPQAKLHIAGEVGVDGIMFPDGTVQTTAGGPGGGGDSTPLGTIIAWHKSLSGTPAIPEGWVECNGQVLSDGESPFDGQVIPNLNGDERFLRGGNVSGTLQDDALQGHRHLINRDTGELPSLEYANGPAGGDGGLIQRGSSGFGTGVDFFVGSPNTDGVNGNPRTADETRPVNMSVVWIMKVKQVAGQSGLWSIGPNGIRYDEGKVSVGTAVADEQLTVAGAISIEEKVLEPDTTTDFGKIYVRENDLSHMSLNGTDQYVSMPSLGNGAVGDFTIALWFRHNDTPRADQDTSFLFDTRATVNTDPGCAGFITSLGNGEFRVDAAFAYSGGGGNHFRQFAGNLIGEWHHYALSREGAGLKIYLDGRLLSSNPEEGGPPEADPFPWNVAWRMGSRFMPSGPNQNFAGDLDDFGIWTRALSDDEVAALHNGGRGSDVPTAFASSLTAFYPMSQSATPGQLDDISGNDFHGTIQNGASITPERVGSLYFKDGFGNVTALAGGGDSYRTGGSGNQVPVGTIMAWHKSFTNTPAIPDGWVECNGQTLDDPASPYNGLIIPDLNNPKESWNAKGSFLRGDTISGDFENDQFQGHYHDQSEIPITNGAGGAAVGAAVGANTGHSILDPINGTNGSVRFGDETRSVNMSVVWIMKVRETDRDRGLWRENGEDIYFDDGLVGVGAKAATAKVHISAEDGFDTPLRVDGQTTLQGVQGRTFRRAIDLENTDTAGLADHQVLLTVDTDALVSAGKMRFDGGDILFVDFDGKTVLPHFIESDMNTAATRIWVRVQAIPAGETRRIFMQYGRPDANSIASGEATFIQALDDLVVAYDYEEGSGTTVADASGNGIPLIFSGSWTTGYRGNGGAYNGSQSSNVLGRNWGFTTFASFSVWIRTTSTANQCVFSLHRDSTNDELGVNIDNGQVKVYSQNGPSVYALRNSTSTANSGDWVHVVGTWNGGIAEEQIRVYVNGVREDGLFEISGSPAPVSDAAPRALHIGYRGNTAQFFTGDIDQVRLFSRPLSDQEVADIYANESLVVPNHQSREFIHKAAPVALNETFNAEEPNPVSGSPILFAQNLTGNIGVGTDDPLGKLHIAGTAGVDGIVFPDGSLQTTAAKAGGGDSTPIGTIIAWHKSLGGTPTIPAGWVECNGQTLDDIDSPYHGQVIPDLNNPKESWNSKGSFLRGDTTSGVFEDDAFQGHRHDKPPGFGDGRYRVADPAGDGSTPGGNGITSNALTTGDPIDDTVNGVPRTDSETRPMNMSVVWIMKIKQMGDIAWEPAPGGIAYAGGDVAIGQTAPNSKLTIDGALSLSESGSTPGETLGFGKLYAREASMRHIEMPGGSNYISVPDLGGSVGDCTLFAWFKLESAPGRNNVLMDMRGDGSTSLTGPALWLNTAADGSVVMNHFISEGPANTFTDKLGFIQGEWHQTAIVREGSLVTAYVDGVPVPRTISYSGSIILNTGRIGHRSTVAGDQSFEGDLSQIAIWDRAIAPHEMAALFKAGREVDLTERYGANLLGYWRVDENDDTTLNDGSGNNHHATLQGSLTYGSESAGSLYYKDGRGATSFLTGSRGFPLSVGESGREVPIGTIMAWHKDLTGTPSMPPGWVECNGQTLSDSESPYDGRTIPNLNGDPVGEHSPGLTETKSMFLRGGLTSGVGQEDAFQGHIHNVYSHAGTQTGEFPQTVNGATGGDTNNLAANAVTSNAANPPQTTSYGNPRASDETRPVNMTVVWIMKIKHTGNGAWEQVSSGLAFTGNRIGIGTTTPSFELDVSGTIQCVNLIQTSDARKKTDVETLGGALELVEKLRGVRFKWHPDAASKTMPAGIGQMGLIAQEVEAIMPEVVSTGQDGYKAIEYGKIVAVLIEAVKELKDKL